MRYCVIVETTPNRRWFTDEAAAIEHAKDLLDQEMRQSKTPKTMMVVAGVKYVRPAVAPIEVVDVD